MKTVAYGWTMGLALGATLAGSGGCGTNAAAPRREATTKASVAPAPIAAHALAYAGPNAIPDAASARARVEEIRGRFLLPSTLAYDVPPGSPLANEELAAPVSALGASVASGFELRGHDVLPVIPSAARRGVARTATVMLPEHAGGPVKLVDDRSHVGVSFTMKGTGKVPVTTAGGVAVYSGALAGADVAYRARAEGTEDYVVFEQRPAIERLAYDVDVSRVAGLRLVGNTLEFLDRAGAPRLRVAPPYVVDAKGGRSEGVLAVEGCAFDANPRAPWGHRVTLPGASHCGVTVTWSSASYPAMVDPSWTATGSMATARVSHTANTLGSGQILLAAGSDSSGNALASAELYDPTSGTFATTGSMTTARFSHTATVLAAGNVLVAGGDDSSADALSSAELYDPTAGTFSVTGSLTTTYAYQTATLLGSGKVLVAGGYNGSVESSAELYDPGTATFTATGSLSTERYTHTATLLSSGLVLMAGGYDNSFNALASAELYDPTAATFSPTGSMVAGRAEHTTTTLASGALLAAGGFDTAGDALASAEIYDPTGGTFAATGSMTTARAAHTATLIGSGQVLVAGGDDTSGTPLSSVEVYDPAVSTFSTSGPMTTTRDGHSASLIGWGEVLVAGGDGSGGILASAELFDSITTDATAYTVGNPITVTWIGLPGNPQDWIAIAPQGSSIGITSDWVYTGGVVSGSYSFTGLPSSGNYVVRAFSNNTYNLLEESTSFSVTSPVATVSTDQASYEPGDSITVSWTGLPGDTTDWVALAPQGSSLDTTTTWAYTGGEASGSYTFVGLSTLGTYVARAFPSGTNTLAGESAPFTVSSPSATVTTDQPSYDPGDSITVSWTGLPGTSTDWIALAPQGSGVGTTTTWAYTGGAPSGSLTFAGGISTSGTYVARAFPEDKDALAGESAPFTVSSTSAVVTTDQSSYGPGANVTVSWTGMPGKSTDWIALAPQGSDDTTVTTWAYTGGTASGSYTFVGGISTAGSYVARAFLQNAYVLAGESSSFSVVASTATITTDQGAYAVGQNIIVTWTNLPGNPKDWIALAPQGSTIGTTTTWVYTGGAISGSYTFTGGIADPGTYVARAFSNDSYALLVESASFTVE